MSRSDDETVADPPGDGGTDFERLLDVAMGAAFSRPPAPPASLAGRYRILREIGRGVMGEVLLARDGSLERDVALKRMRPEQRDNVKARARFIREAVIAGQLQHPGVVPLYELGQDAEGGVFLTMRPIEGATLAQRLTSRPSVAHELPALLRAFEQVCQTMAYAHSRGVIHRDLKPDNIMLGAFGEVQILDWGLAKVLGGPPEDAPAGSPSEALSPGPDNLSVDGAVLGTPLYMAPEQAVGDLAAVDARTDVFSLGAILCEILTGQPLYTARDATTAISRAALADLSEVYTRLERLAVDPALRDLARACLQPDKAARPKDAGEVAARLGAYLAGVEERARAA
ncbi:MAG TPA: serine/threonine-protein kinase [Planctomycetota bacterium]|nr:serine/threonine-protein kinase [Planctomycetota bacterium]